MTNGRLDYWEAHRLAEAAHAYASQMGENGPHAVLTGLIGDLLMRVSADDVRELTARFRRYAPDQTTLTEVR